MKSEVLDKLTYIAKRSGALVRCDVCRRHDVNADDEAANEVANGSIMAAWKRGEFGPVRIDEIRAAAAAILRDGEEECPGCHAATNHGRPPAGARAPEHRPHA